MKRLLIYFLLLISICGNAQTETHDFITYDTTVTVTGGQWDMRITRPANMFTAGNPDTASRPAIIFMVGMGEVHGAGLMSTFGPHYWLNYTVQNTGFSNNGGWNGDINLANGTHYPIIISLAP